MNVAGGGREGEGGRGGGREMGRGRERDGWREWTRGNELCLHMPKVVTDEWLVHVYIQYMYLCTHTEWTMVSNN